MFQLSKLCRYCDIGTPKSTVMHMGSKRWLPLQAVSGDPTPIFSVSCRPRKVLPDFMNQFWNWCIFWKIAERKKSDSDQKCTFARSPLTKENRLDHWNFQDGYISECSINAKNIRPPTFPNQKLWVRKLDKYVHFFIYWMIHEIVTALYCSTKIFL